MNVLIPVLLSRLLMSTVIPLRVSEPLKLKNTSYFQQRADEGGDAEAVWELKAIERTVRKEETAGTRERVGVSWRQVLLINNCYKI